MKNILITGSHGFIGKHLVNCLEKRKDVKLRIFDQKINSLSNKESLLKLVKNSDIIFHLAAINDASSSKIFEVNVLGLINLLDAVSEAAPECKIIFPSSFSVYRTPKKGEIIKEDFEIMPRNKYGLSKFLSEEIIKFYINTRDIKGVILRLANVYGPGIEPYRHSVVATFLRQIKKGESITINGDGNQTRDFIYVNDVVNAMVLAAFNPVNKKIPVFNICSGKETSINMLISLIEKIVGKRARKLYKQADNSSGGYWQGNNVLVKRFLSWQPKITLGKGLKSIYLGKKCGLES